MQKPIRFILISLLMVIPHINADANSDLNTISSVGDIRHLQANPHHPVLRQTYGNAQEIQGDVASANSETAIKSSFRSEGIQPKQSVAAAVNESTRDSPRSSGKRSYAQTENAGATRDANTASGCHSKIVQSDTLGRNARMLSMFGLITRRSHRGKRAAVEPTGQGPRMPDLVQETGYPVETHYVETKDGYILALHRVRKKNFVMQSPRVALLWHGFLGSSADWVLNGPEHSLAYLLANDDIDVWMGNSRGNIYSRNHTKLDPESRDFWNFGMHEIGKYDVMASIDYVMKVTTASKIFAITHSTGVAGFLIALNERGIYQNRIHGLVAMAPVTSVKYTSSKLMNLLMSSYGLLKTDLLDFFIGKTYFDTPKLLGESLVPTFCATEAAAPYCENPLFMLTGFPDKPFRPAPELINANTPAGTSKKMLIHLAQMGLSGLFQNFDLGEDENQEVYGFSWAPDYIIDKLMTRVIFFSSKDDLFVSDQDVANLARQIARLQGKIKVKRPNFGHTDFLWAQDAREQVYERLLREINGLAGH